VGKAVRREALVAGLAQAEENETEGSEWANRLRRWRQGVAQTADGGLELIVATSGIRMVTQSLREFVAPGGINFEPLLASRGPGMPEKPAAVLSVEKPDVRVVAGEKNTVTVTLQSWPADRLPPGILVIDKLGKQRSLRLELIRGADGVYKTEFSREPGEFMILFAPVERKEND
jgi:hypothetical protein